MKLGGEMRNTMFFDDNSKLLAVRTTTYLSDVANFEGKKYRTRLLKKHDFRRGEYSSPYYDFCLEEIAE